MDYQMDLTTKAEKMQQQVVAQLMTARAKKGLSHKELSDISGVPKIDIVNMESFESTPSLLTCCKLADALGVTIKVSSDDMTGYIGYRGTKLVDENINVPCSTLTEEEQEIANQLVKSRHARSRTYDTIDAHSRYLEEQEEDRRPKGRRYND